MNWERSSSESFALSLLASAGALGVLVAIAARPLLGNMVAGFQIALTDPVRIGDVVVYDGHWATVEDISFAHTVLRTWLDTRLIVPHSDFLSKSFENWSKEGEAVRRIVKIPVDFRMDVDQIRPTRLTWRRVILIAGIAGVDPEEGTLGSAHWARWVVDGGLRHLIDPREIPEDWSTASLPLGTTEPGGEGGWSAGSGVYELNADLVDHALELTEGVELADSDRAAEYRATYDAEAARRAPFVSACDTVWSDTYWHGRIVAEAMEDRAARLTEGEATYCTTQMEDNGTLTALSRAAEAGAVDFDRIAVLRTGSNFDRQPAGQSAAASLAADPGGFGPATENAFRVAKAFAQEIIRNWDDWKDGVPIEP